MCLNVLWANQIQHLVIEILRLCLHNVVCIADMLSSNRNKILAYLNIFTQDYKQLTAQPPFTCVWLCAPLHEFLKTKHFKTEHTHVLSVNLFPTDDDLKFHNLYPFLNSRVLHELGWQFVATNTHTHKHSND